jgi:hypothetical protein
MPPTQCVLESRLIGLPPLPGGPGCTIKSAWRAESRHGKVALMSHIGHHGGNVKFFVNINHTVKKEHSDTGIPCRPQHTAPPFR